ncbi:MAG: T9SS type A sorting domain-containing protein, partial [Flavobacteriaceae bacterium]|nr:T9SS type A sorting domain-containing protein [Flavobacteriaceae bacterium]
SVQLSIGIQNAASYDIAVGISGAYINKKTAPSSIAVVTVSKYISGGYIVGGGSLKNSNSSGLLKGATNENTSFSFDVSYNKKMTNPQGKSYIAFFSYYNTNGIMDGILHQYQITSNAISVLAVGQPSKPQASFTSKANLIEVFDGYTVAIEGGALLQLTMTDGNPDKFGITLQRKAGGIWFSSNWVTNKTVEQALHTGQLTVAGSGVNARTSESETTASSPVTQAVASEQLEVEAISFTATAYPNPSTAYFTLRLQGATQDQVQVNVFDVNGRQVYTKIGNYNDNYQFGERFQAGIYLVNVQQGTNKVSLKVIKQ